MLSVYSRNFERCSAFAKKFGACAFKSAKEAINAECVDGVYIVTPHNSHYEYSMLSIEAGKPVLCEKPFTVDCSSAREVFDFAKERGIYIAEAMWTWFSPVANKVKEWLTLGEFGEVKRAFAKWHIPGNYAPRVTDPNTAGGALLDIGVYPATYAYRLFGKPQKIECAGTVKNGIDLCEDFKFIYSSGMEFSASVSIKRLDCIERLKIEGSKAKISLPFFHCAGKVKLIRKGAKNQTFRGNGSYLNEFDVVAKEIKEGLKESRLVPFKSTIEVMELLDESRRQLNLVYPFEVKE